eukprot:768548-Hanusia_phi.AAC.5
MSPWLSAAPRRGRDFCRACRPGGCPPPRPGPTGSSPRCHFAVSLPPLARSLARPVVDRFSCVLPSSPARRPRAAKLAGKLGRAAQILELKEISARQTRRRAGNEGGGENGRGGTRSLGGRGGGGKAGGGR